MLFSMGVTCADGILMIGMSITSNISFGRTVIALNHSAISPALEPTLTVVAF